MRNCAPRASIEGGDTPGSPLSERNRSRRMRPSRSILVEELVVEHRRGQGNPVPGVALAL